MGRDRRLTEAYGNARVEHFGDRSRFVFISDCHRGDGGHSDEFTRNENSYLHALDHYYRNGFVYVEVGDGDELWEQPRFSYIRRAHAEAFDSIKRFFDEGRAILIWGNHNNYLRHRAYVEKHLYIEWDPQTHARSDFLPGVEPCEALRLVHEGSGQEFLVLHGHQGDLINDRLWFVAMFGVRHFWRHLRAFGARNPSSPAMNRHKRDAIERDYHEWVARHKTPLICGHTHVHSYPRGDEVPYFNAGACVYPTSMTAIELEDGEISLVRWRVVANAEGVLQVARHVLRGPKPVSRFDMR